MVINASLLGEIPARPGVYLMRDRHDNILYIGKSKRLRERVRSYFRPGQKKSDRITLMVKQVEDIECIITDTEAEALALEANLIKQYQPYYNVLLKDDKKYPYICITWSEDYPRIFITRKRRMKNSLDRYYGPYVDSGILKHTLEIIKRVFPLRQRPKPLFKDRPCLNYDIGRCVGVCQGLIHPQEYHHLVEKVAMIFQGRSSELMASLQAEMERLARELKFEEAAKVRDRINALSSLHGEQKVALPDESISQDAIALARNSSHCCIQLFQVRGGKLVGRLGFFVDVALEKEDNPHNNRLILQRVLEEHYQGLDGVEIPTEILVQYELEEPEILTQWLREKKGRKVSIIHPQRQSKLGQSKAGLIALVEKNAGYELQRIEKANDRTQKALEDLTILLDLPTIPKRIEGYDISHLQGTHAVASQVVFIDGIPAKQFYRHYKIKNPTVTLGHSDDFASLAEVLKRRFRAYIEPDIEQENLSPKDKADFPDLVLIDGGKGQLSAVVSILQENTEVPLLEELKVISLAKKREEIFLPGESLPLPCDREQPGVQLLRRVRDEAHRFAVSFHRQQRLKASRRSQLRDIPGLGFERQKQLLAYFHSIDYIRQATPQQLQQVPGIGPHLAQTIYNYFHC